MKKSDKIYIAGHDGMVGSAIVRKLKIEGYHNLVFRTIDQLNLINQEETLKFFQKEKPEYVFLAAARVGGIIANDSFGIRNPYAAVEISHPPLPPPPPLGWSAGNPGPPASLITRLVSSRSSSPLIPLAKSIMTGLPLTSAPV